MGLEMPGNDEANRKSQKLSPLVNGSKNGIPIHLIYREMGHHCNGLFMNLGACYRHTLSFVIVTKGNSF